MVPDEQRSIGSPAASRSLCRVPPYFVILDLLLNLARILLLEYLLFLSGRKMNQYVLFRFVDNDGNHYHESYFPPLSHVFLLPEGEKNLCVF